MDDQDRHCLYFGPKSLLYVLCTIYVMEFQVMCSYVDEDVKMDTLHICVPSIPESNRSLL